ncbi:MAG: PLDc N-terminal domain-containing protein [Desulfatitalea sp.]|nr:PLDc N-terminal domain-containing protein [Desulfatitalea sp.]
MSSAEWIILTGIAFFLLTCWAIFDIARKDFGGIEKKAAWAFVTMIPFLGPIIYIAAGFRKGTKKADA